MPKKVPQTKEEKTAGNYFPVDSSNVKYAIEKTYKKPSIEDVEKIIGVIPGKKSPKRKYSKKKTYKRKAVKKKFSRNSGQTQSQKIQNFSPPDIKLQKNSYELVITEKPQAANKIASALGKAIRKDTGRQGVSYYEVQRGDKKIIVACAVGHLFTLKQISPGKANEPVFDIKWVPNYLAQKPGKTDFTKKYHDQILTLAKKASKITVATDYDIEGEVIGLNIVRYICNQPDASRMKFSTLTQDELNNSYENKFPTLNWPSAIAGETRHYLDWFYGINLSRALMNAIKTTGRFKLMSIGRVQGPTLNLIVKKEKQIQKFKPEPYWQVFITIQDPENPYIKIELKHNKDLFNKSELEKFENLKNSKAIAETKNKKQKLPPQPPFNLTTLQTEAYKFHSITPSETLKSAQSLYLSGLISYPRTSSQKLPSSINYQEILKKLSKEYGVEHLIKKSQPIEGKKTDPAHPSIYPTASYSETGGKSPILAGNEEKIYELIVRRFLSLFCEDAIIDKKTISAETSENKLKFSTRGDVIEKKSWLEIYPSKIKEIKLPDINGEVDIIDLRNEEKETQPPKRFTQASIISQLEKKNLGTKATRSSILETLYDRDYVKEKSIEATSLGISLIETLEKYSPIIIDEKLTREIEKEMSEIEKTKKPQEKQKSIIEKSKKIIIDIAKDFEKNENKIGQELLQANIEQIEQKKIDNTLMTCPKCQKGNLIINYSKKFKRFFVACDAYPDCKNTYTLPPNGIIKPVTPGRICEKCSWPMLMRLSKGKRPWIFCFNPDCETNRERIEEYEKRKREESR
ncbi:DNA topoisomerase I [Candidatus Pacearchaeota archaeon]|nr:DNA topoisomerase I [Candidatus Pacearchaeota archaeon]